MRCALVLMATVLIFSTPGVAVAQQNTPAIIPERIQEIAKEFPVAERLDIKWDSATPEDTGRYIGFLAAANVIAETIASENDRPQPSDDDYEAAFSLLCLFPPHKPPMVQQYWPKAIPAYYSEAVRLAIRESVGPNAAELTKDAGGIETFVFPEEPEEYFDEMLDLRTLDSAQ